MRFSEISKTALRAMPGMKRLLNIKAVHGREIGHFSGIFETGEEALLSAPTESRSTWDDEALIEGGIETFSSIHVFDWPVIYFLQQRFREQPRAVVTDFGGHIGVKFTAYRQVISFPETLRWQVVDVPAVINVAQRRISPEVPSLQFFERLEDTQPCDVLLCSGSLQYVRESVEEVVNRMPQRPPIILLNKVPVSMRRSYFTVERYIKSLVYRVYGPSELSEIRTRLGYTLAAKWAIPHRDILVLHSRGVEHVEMIGEAWTLSTSLVN